MTTLPHRLLASATPTLTTFFLLLLILLLSHAGPAAGSPQLLPPPTISCDDCMASTGVKWCTRCTMAPVHCTLQFSVPCDAVVDPYCRSGSMKECWHVPAKSSSASSAAPDAGVSSAGTATAAAATTSVAVEPAATTGSAA